MSASGTPEPAGATPEPAGASPEPAGATADGEVPAGGRAPWRTLVVGAGLALAFLVGAAVVTLAGPTDAPPADTPPGAVVQTPVPLASRVPPTRQSPLPDLVLEGFDGAAPVDLAAYRGRPLVVNLWATWCRPCVDEMPDIERVATELGDAVAVLGVNVRDAPANAATFAAELGVTYDLAADPRGELYVAVDAFGMPTTLLVTPDGTIVYRHTGLLDAAQLRALVAEHLGVDAGPEAGTGAGIGAVAGWRPATTLG